MSWIKRNLLFVVGGLVAAGLLGWAGFYSYSRWKLNSDAREQINAQYEELKRLNNLNPHPGNNKVDNIAIARKQRDSLTNIILRAQKQFVPISPIPQSEKVTSEEFAAALRRAIDQLQRDANGAGVVLPPRYSFSFEAQRPLVRFAPGSLEPLSTQLGEVKTICDVLMKAKINTLDGIRRERVSADDQNGPVTDYLDISGKTNDLAIMTPYEVSFRCFSPELADVIAGLASSPHSLVVRTLNVAVAPSTVGGPAADGMTPMPVYGQPQYPAGPGPSPADYARPKGGAEGLYQPGSTPPPNYPPPAAGSRAPGALQTFINEKQLRVTMLIDVIKLLPKQQEQ